MTVDELRKTDDFLYRLVIAHAVATGPNILRDVTLVTDLDCFCYIMYIEDETELTAIPEYARTVIVQFFARIMFPNNTVFPTDDDAVNKLLNRVVFDHPRIQLERYYNQLYPAELVGEPASYIIADLQAYLAQYGYAP